MTDISRRDLLRTLLGRRTPAVVTTPTPSAEPPLALILDRFCLAWQNSFCSVCAERCPQPEAIQLQQGRPRVNPDVCTGCGICRDVCPAPQNAVFLVPRKPRQGMVVRPAEATIP